MRDIYTQGDRRDFYLMQLAVSTRRGTADCFSLHQLPPDLPQTIYLAGRVGYWVADLRPIW